MYTYLLHKNGPWNNTRAAIPAATETHISSFYVAEGERKEEARQWASSSIIQGPSSLYSKGEV